MIGCCCSGKDVGVPAQVGLRLGSVDVHTQALHLLTSDIAQRQDAYMPDSSGKFGPVAFVLSKPNKQHGVFVCGSAFFNIFGLALLRAMTFVVAAVCARRVPNAHMAI